MSIATGQDTAVNRAPLTVTTVLAAALVTLLAVFLFLQNNDYPLGVQPDEDKKVEFVLNGDQDFMHPILMLEASRFANLFAKASEAQDVVVLGRTMTALFGGLLVLATFLLVRKALASDALAFFAATSVAIVPLVAIHAQLMKEDIYVGAMAMLTLFFVIGYAEAPTRLGAVVLGAFAGFAASAKHAGLLVLLVPLIVPFVCRLPDRSAYWRRLPLALATTVAVYAVVNAPALMAYRRSLDGVASEINHVSRGHGAFVSPFQTYFVHYVREGFIKGMGVWLGIVGLLGMVVAVWRWKTLGTALRVPLVFAVIWYLAHELAPMKPGVSRYMVPLAPVIALYAAFLFSDLLSRMAWTRAAAYPLAGMAVLILALVPARKTLDYLVLGEADTSQSVIGFADALGGKVFFDDGTPAGRRSSDGLNKMAIRAAREGNPPGLNLLADWSYVVTRNVKGRKATSHEGELSALGQLYGALYSRGYIEVAHRSRDYEFRNRPFRIVSLEGEDSALEALAAKWPWPETVHVTFTPGSSTPAQPPRLAPGQ